MIGLPPALRVWTEDLAMFPPDVALSIAPWLPSVASSIGALASRNDRGDGDPDGFVGLSRRGPYDRLLLSEWLMADAAPDEFVRRAAMSEHNFLELARTSPEGSKRSLVLFDAGPHQLGAPRIAHLAALIVLHRRARDAGAEFLWGVLQDDERRIYEVVDEQSIRALLHARSLAETTKDKVESWLDEMECDDHGEPDDVWIVGGTRTERMVRNTSCFLVDDVVLPSARRLAVRIERKNLSTRIELELPKPRAATRLLRNPFEVPTKYEPTNRANLATRSQLLVSHDGRRVFVRYGFGVRVFPMPPDPWQSIAEPRHLGLPSQAIVAAGAHRRNFYLVAMVGEHHMLLGYSKRGEEVYNAVLTFDNDVPTWRPGRSTPLGLLIPRGKGSPPRRFLWHDEVGRLFRIDPAQGRVGLLHDDVSSVVRNNGHIHGAIQGEGEVHHFLEFDVPGDHYVRRNFKATSPLKLAYGVDGMRTTYTHFGDDTWGPIDYSERDTIQLPFPEEVICTARATTGLRGCGLVTIDEDRLRLRLHTVDQDPRTIWQSSAKIVAAAAHVPVVAVVTEDEELVIVNVDRPGRTAAFKLHRPAP